MSWFEQGTSNARCTITQFHRPAELKLKRILAVCLLPYVLRTYGNFCFWKEAAHRGSQSKLHTAHKTMDLGFPRAFLPLAVFSACLSDHRFAGNPLQDDGLFMPFFGKQRSLSDCIDDSNTSEVKEMNTGSSNSAGSAGRSRIAVKSDARLIRAALS